MKSFKELLLEQEYFDGKEVVWSKDNVKICKEFEGFCVYIGQEKADQLFISIHDALLFLVKTYDLRIEKSVFTYWKNYS